MSLIRAGPGKRSPWFYVMCVLLAILVACLLYIGPGTNWIQWLLAGTIILVSFVLIELAIESMFFFAK
jgi:hypothetical protein